LITKSSIVDDFMVYRILRITEVSLPMDRAQALYKMTYDNREEFGMHWVAQQHVAESTEWQAILKECGGSPTINKRFLWLSEVEGLGFEGRAEWLKPLRAPWSGQDPPKGLAD
jgi:hypothetical protein